MSWLRINEVVFMKNRLRELGFETLRKISQHSLSRSYRLSCRLQIELSESKQVAVFTYDGEEIPYLEFDPVHSSYSHHMTSRVYSK